MTEREIVVASLVHTPARLVWRTVDTIDGINRELAPWLSLTVPTGHGPLEAAEPDAPPVRSWLLAFGVVPIARVVIRVERVTACHEFVETLETVLRLRFRHERRLRDVGPAWCQVVDRLRFRPRFALPGSWIDQIVLRVFVHRHRRLQQAFGGHFVEPT